MLVVVKNSNVCGFPHPDRLRIIFHHRGFFDIGQNPEQGQQNFDLRQRGSGGGVTTSLQEFFSASLDLCLYSPSANIFASFQAATLG